jgi:hypothetical protein
MRIGEVVGSDVAAIEFSIFVGTVKPVLFTMNQAEKRLIP